jgi:ubiquitin C-terminal hydrolase
MRKYVEALKSEKQPVYYDLYAVANHFGDLDEGHYTAYCFNPVFK